MCETQNFWGGPFIQQRYSKDSPFIDIPLDLSWKNYKWAPKPPMKQFLRTMDIKCHTQKSKYAPFAVISENISNTECGLTVLNTYFRTLPENIWRRKMFFSLVSHKPREKGSYAVKLIPRLTKYILYVRYGQILKFYIIFLFMKDPVTTRQSFPYFLHRFGAAKAESCRTQWIQVHLWD